MNDGIIVLALSAFIGLVLVGAFFRAQTRGFAQYLLRDEMPIWLSLSLAFFAAGGAYLLAPLINENLEVQKNRSSYVVSTISDTNRDFVELTKNIRRFNDALFYKAADISSRRGDVLDKIAEIGWKTVNIETIIRRSGNSTQCVGNLNASLAKLKSEVVAARIPEDQEIVIAEYGNTTKIMKNCLLILYSAAELT